MSLSSVIARVFISIYCAAGCTSMCHCAGSWTDSGSQESERGAVAGREEVATAHSPPSSCSNTYTHSLVDGWGGWGLSALLRSFIFYSAKDAWRIRHNCIQKERVLMFTQPFFFCLFLYLFLTIFSLCPLAASPLDSTLLISSPPASTIFTSVWLIWKLIPSPGKQTWQLNSNTHHCCKIQAWHKCRITYSKRFVLES